MRLRVRHPGSHDTVFVRMAWPPGAVILREILRPEESSGLRQQNGARPFPTILLSEWEEVSRQEIRLSPLLYLLPSTFYLLPSAFYFLLGWRTLRKGLSA